jgi:small ligand-binding sensory domain FIST
LIGVGLYGKVTVVQVGVGLSLLRDTQQAAIEATETALGRAGCSEADLALVFATFSHAPQYSEMLAAIQPMTRALVGCSGQGIITTDEEVEQAPAIGKSL